MSVAITYAPGTYGTYLEWCLTMLTSSDPIVPPFTSVGNSHLFSGNHLLSLSAYNATKSEFISSLEFFRLHPRVNKKESVVGTAIHLAKQSHSVILLYPEQGRTLLCLNNFFNKIHKDRWSKFFESFSVHPTVIFDNWPVPPDTEIKDVAPWIKREFLSLYIMPFWDSLVGYQELSNFDYPKCLHVNVGDLLLNFETTIQQIKNSFGLNFKRGIEDLMPYHQHNLSLQQFLHHDSLCNTLVDCVVNGVDMSWDPLGICSESYVQWNLRERGFEIRCNGLDTFPTNSLQLKDLLYSI